jgi:hypothetical protein
MCYCAAAGDSTLARKRLNVARPYITDLSQAMLVLLASREHARTNAMQFRRSLISASNLLSPVATEDASAAGDAIEMLL